MKERIATNIYMSITGDNPFNRMISSANKINKISFKIAEEELSKISDDEGLLSDYKDLSMIQESNSGMVKEEDFTDFDLDSDYECESDLSMIQKSDNGMVKEAGLCADIDSQVMEIDEPGDTGSDDREISDEYAKQIKKTNKNLFKQGAFEDIVNFEDLRMAFPYHSVQMELDKLYDELSYDDDKQELDNITQAKIKRIYIKWKKYMNYVKREAKKDIAYHDAYMKAKVADKPFNILANKKGVDWKELFVTVLAKIKRAHEALYII